MRQLTLAVLLFLFAAPAFGDQHPFLADEGTPLRDGAALTRLGGSALADWTRNSARGRREEPEPQGRFGIEERPSGGRSLGQAAWRSIVLPGWGQRYLGAPARGMFFMTGEALTWGTWSTFKTQEWLRKRSYTEMAEVFAGVGGDHADDYWKIVGQYSNHIDYNEWLRFQGRREYGFGTAEYYSFIAEHQIGSALAWTWNNEERREAYAIKRKASLNAERRATYTLYALLVNRVVSLVDTWRISRSRGAIEDALERQIGGTLDLQSQPTADGLSWRLGWYRQF